MADNFRKTTLITLITVMAVTSTVAFGQRIGGAQKVPDFFVPTRVGILAAHVDGHVVPGMNIGNSTAATHIAAGGFHAIKIWPATTDVFDPDMVSVILNPSFDVIVIRPLNDAYYGVQGCDPNRSSYRWEASSQDFGQIAQQLYQQFGYLQKDIILTNWEGDWQIKGPWCSEYVPTQAEQGSFLSLLNARQQGIQSARNSFLMRICMFTTRWK